MSESSLDYTYKIQALQIELSSVCNSLCLGCVRTDSTFNKSKDFIHKNKILDIDLIKSIFQTNKGKKINRVEFCGNIDEPLAHPQFLELLDQLQLINPELVIHIHTNGSIRDENYHILLSEKIMKFASPSSIRYGIDGLADTHSIYRQGTSFNKAFKNMKAACTTGGRVIWQFLIFPWNRHQVDQARELAAQAGCSEIWFRPDRSRVTEIGLAKIQKIKTDVSRVDLHEKKKEAEYVPDPGKHVSIECKFINEGYSTLFLNWKGEVWPCCFHANVFYESLSKQNIFKKLVLKGCQDNFNSLHFNSFDEVCDHPFFSNYLKSSWDNTSDLRRWRCVEKCRSGKRRSSDNEIEVANNSGITRHKLMNMEN